MLIELAIAGVAAYLGADAYQKRRQKQRLVQWLGAKQHAVRQNGYIASVSNEIAMRLTRIGTETLTPLLPQTRATQLSEVSSAPQRLIHDAEKDTNRKLAIATFSLGIAGAGFLFYLPLALLSLPGVLYISRDSFRRGRVRGIQPKR